MSWETGCSLIGGAAGTIVQEGWQLFANESTGMIQQSYAKANELLTNFSELTLTPVNTDISFDVPENLGTPFTKPTAPTDPDLDFNSVESPGNLSVPDVAMPTFSAAPELDAASPGITPPSDPGDLTATAPGDAPDTVTVTLPTEPTIVLPDDPTLEDITLPSVPTLNLPTFTATLPGFDLTAPSDTFDYTYEAYAAQLPGLITKVQEMLAGGTGLPDEIWNSLWARARERGDMDAARAIEEATEEWSARGFSLPNGVLDKKIATARQQNQNASSELSREIAIKQADMEVENIRFAVTQGIALESLYAQIHQQAQQLKYEAARYVLEAAVAIFNAQIAYQNAQLQAYVTEAQVYRTRIEAELANVELYKAQLDGQRIVGEINQQAVNLYNAKLQGLLTHIEVYKGQLEGVRTLVDVNKNEIEAFRAGVDAFTAQVQAHAAEIQTYTAKWQGEQIKAQVYGTEVQAFAQRVQAYKTANDSTIAAKDLEIRNNGYLLDKFKAQIQRYSADVDAEAKRIAAGVDVYNGKATLYSAELNAEQARVIADSRQFELALEEAKTDAELELKEAQINIEQLLRILQMEMEQQKTLLSVQAQIAAATMSAMNLSAVAQESESNSASCNTSHSYSY